MSNPISFMTANWVARQVDWNMTRGWGQGDKASSEYFRPIETFRERLDEYLKDVRDLGFDALDMWTGIISPVWVTDEHLSIARALLDQYNLRVLSLAGWFGSNAEELEKCCRIAVTLDHAILGGSTSMLEKDRPYVVSLLKQHNLKLGLENHPEKHPQEMIDRVGDGGDGTIGVCIDTGWFGTQGYDAAQALEELKDVLFYVHLKDVLAVGAHDTCRYGQGIVPIRECVETLKRIGYTGGISIEHEPEHSNPNEDVKASLALLKEWLS
jgi:L-ribulose-5-phosphate 3-epimerase